MTTLNERIETNLLLQDAFAFIADFANAGRWDPGVATSERLDAGPLRVGARYRLGVRMRGRVAPMEYADHGLEPPHRVVLSGRGSGVAAVDDIRFEATAEAGTRIDYTADIRLRGLLRLLTPFAGAAFAKIARDAATGMQRALDRAAERRVRPAWTIADRRSGDQRPDRACARRCPPTDHRVHLFERETAPRRAHPTVPVERPDGPVPVDTGFIVYNETDLPAVRRAARASSGSRPSRATCRSAARVAACGIEFSSRGARGIFAAGLPRRPPVALVDGRRRVPLLRGRAPSHRWPRARRVDDPRRVARRPRVRPRPSGTTSSSRSTSAVWSTGMRTGSRVPRRLPAPLPRQPRADRLSQRPCSGARSRGIGGVRASRSSPGWRPGPSRRAARWWRSRREAARGHRRDRRRARTSGSTPSSWRPTRTTRCACCATPTRASAPRSAASSTRRTRSSCTRTSGCCRRGERARASWNVETADCRRPADAADDDLPHEPAPTAPGPNAVPASRSTRATAIGPNT